MISDLGKTGGKVVGTKQTINSITENNVKIVFLAEDIDQDIKKKIITLCKEHDISVKKVESKLKLGRACDIDVGAACAALLEE